MMKRIGNIIIVTLSILLSSCSEKLETSIFDVLPTQTAIMVESRNSREFVSAMHPYFQSADILQSFENEFLEYDSIFSSDERLSASVKNAQFVFCVSKTNENYEPFVIAKLNKMLSNKDFNIPSNRPMIQESQSMANNGGGGNLGYFQRGKKKKEDEPQNLWQEEDKFESSTKDNDDDDFIEEEEQKPGFGHRLLDKMKKLLD